VPTKKMFDVHYAILRWWSILCGLEVPEFIFVGGEPIAIEAADGPICFVHSY
jgi:hypothetical protein